MKKIVIFIVTAFMVSTLFSACEVPFSDIAHTQDSQQINVLIAALPYELSSLGETSGVCSKFDEAIDCVGNAQSGVQQVQLQLLGEKCLAFYNSYLTLSEQSDEASDVVGDLFDDENSAALTRICEEAVSSGGYSVDSDALTKILSAFTDEYNELLSLSDSNEYFKASPFSYDEVRSNADTVLYEIDNAILYRNDETLTGSERTEKITASLENATQCIERNDAMHNETLEVLGGYANDILLFVEKAGTYME